MIPIWTIGFVIGFIGAIMGIGGGFMLVPALIYLMRVPTGVVIGTSMVLTLVTMAYATIIHAATNHLVDALLALLLMIGGVIGAQFGARTGQRFSGEQLRLLLGLLVLSVGLRFAYDLVVQPADLFTMRPSRRSNERAPHHRGAAATLLALATPAAAERLVSTLSTSRVLIASNFTGADVVLFGSVERDAQTVARRGGYDIVVTVTGPRETIVTFRKQRVAGVWVNADSRTFVEGAVLSRGARQPHRSTTSPTSTRCGAPRPASRARCCRRRSPATSANSIRDDPFRQAFLRLKIDQRLYREQQNGVTFLTPALFRATIPIPDNAPTGVYEIDVKLFADGALLARTQTAIEVVKVGFEQVVANAARDHGLLYGLATALMALLTGWFASVVFRKD